MRSRLVAAAVVVAALGASLTGCAGTPPTFEGRPVADFDALMTETTQSWRGMFAEGSVEMPADAACFAVVADGASGGRELSGVVHCGPLRLPEGTTSTWYWSRTAFTADPTASAQDSGVVLRVSEPFFSGSLPAESAAGPVTGLGAGGRTTDFAAPSAR